MHDVGTNESPTEKKIVFLLLVVSTLQCNVVDVLNEISFLFTLERLKHSEYRRVEGGGDLDTGTEVVQCLH